MSNTLIDKFCKSTGADIRSEENEAYYSPLGDYINMPDTALFYDTKHASATENYYSTLLHELTHWTGGKSGWIVRMIQIKNTLKITPLKN